MGGGGHLHTFSDPSEHGFFSYGLGRTFGSGGFLDRGHFQSACLHANKLGIELGRIELGVGQGNHDLGLSHVIFDPLVHFLHPLGKFGGQVRFLSDILLQIVQPVLVLSIFPIVEGANEFPFSVMHRH